MRAIRSAFLDFTGDPFQADDDREVLRHVPDGLLVIGDDGTIVDFGPYAEIIAENDGLDIDHYPDRIVLPGFVDCHVHYAQTEVVSTYGERSLGWLENHVFRTELKLADKGYAHSIASFFLDSLIQNGTTTALAFTTTSPASVDAFFEEASARNLLMVAGLTGIDREGTAPEDYRDTAHSFYANSRELVDRWHNVGRNRYAITPRSAYGSTREQLDYCGQLKSETPDLWVNTHMCENPKEIQGVAEFFPESSDYLNVYERAGIVGPKFVAVHSIHIGDSIIERMADSQSSIAFCPMSNLFLGSGLFKLRETTFRENPVLVGLGTGMGAGNSFGMLPVLEQAYKVAALRETKLSAFRALYLATLGGARALWLDGEIGSFDPGKAADVVVCDTAATPMQHFRHERLVADDDIDLLHQQLFGMMMMGDERNVVATYVAGENAYTRPAGA